MAGDGARRADHCGTGHDGDGAGERPCLFALAVVVADRVPDARHGGDAAGPSATAIYLCVSASGACGRYSVAGSDFDVCACPARSLLSLLCVCHSGGGLPLGIVGDGDHGKHGHCALVARVSCHQRWTGSGCEQVAGDPSSSLSCQLSGIGSRAAHHDVGVLAGARHSARLHGAKSEKSSRRARRDHARFEFDARGGGIDRDDAADSRGDDEHLRSAPDSKRFAGVEQLSSFSRGDKARLRWRAGRGALARGGAGERDCLSF